MSDVILNGGEIASLLFIESFMRLQPEVLGNKDTHLLESFHEGLLEHDQFTRPNPWIGPDNQPYEVPTILTNGNNGEIEAWKKQNAIENTEKNRPDLMKNYLIFSSLLTRRSLSAFVLFSSKKLRQFIFK